MKALTTTATIFLPATLIAVGFFFFFGIDYLKNAEQLTDIIQFKLNSATAKWFFRW